MPFEWPPKAKIDRENCRGKFVGIIHGQLNENDKHWGMRSKLNLLKKLERSDVSGQVFRQKENVRMD